jgi:hypothetical protein
MMSLVPHEVLVVAFLLIASKQMKFLHWLLLK